MNKKLRLERLTELEYMLLNHKKIFKSRGVSFDLGNWAQKISDLVEAKLFNKQIGKAPQEKTICGSAACALGSAALYDPFIKQGLKLVANSIDAIEKEGAEIPEYEYELEFIPTYRGFKQEQAGAKFFGITDEESSNIFMPWNYTQSNPTPKDVAKRVKSLINQYQEAA